MNKILENYFEDLTTDKQEVSAHTKFKPLMHYFDFLAREFDLESKDDITEKHIAATNIDTIKKYEKSLYDLKYSDRTIRERLTCIKSFYTYTINNPENGILMKHPFFNFKLPEKTLRNFKLFEPDYYISFIGNFKEFMKLRNQAIVTLLITTGIKLVDLIELSMADIVFDENDIPAAMNIKNRRIPLNKALKVILKRYIEEERSFIIDNNHKCDALFLSRKCKPIHQTTIMLMLRQESEKQKLDKETVNPSTLQHLAITTYKQCGGGDLGIRDLFGKYIGDLQFPSTNIEPFFENPLINGLYDLFVNDNWRNYS